MEEVDGGGRAGRRSHDVEGRALAVLDIAEQGFGPVRDFVWVGPPGRRIGGGSWILTPLT